MSAILEAFDAETNEACSAQLVCVHSVVGSVRHHPDRREIRQRSVGSAEIRTGSQKAATDAQGVAVMPVPRGPVTLAISKEGYFPANITVAIEEAREYAVAVQLQPQETLEEKVTVFATRTDTRLQDSPVRVEVLNQDEIDEKTMMTPGDIVMMLNEMGGLRVQTTLPSLGAATVRIQGMRGRYTRFLTDGLPLFGQQGAGLGLLQIPPVDLGQVEVIKGNSSALYGAGAMAGVVNLIARRPGAEPVHEFLFNQTTLGGTDASLFLASKLGRNFGGSFLGSGDWQRRKDVDGDGWADLAGYQRGVVRPRLYWDNGSGTNALLTGGVTYETREGGTMPDSVLQATGNPYSEAVETRRYDAGLNAQTVLSHRYVLAVRFAAAEQKHDHQFGENRERDRHEMVFGEVTVRGTAGRNTWVAGAAAEREAFIPRDTPRFGYRYTTPGLFLQDDLTVASWLSMSASVRADFHSEYGTFVSPRISALLRWRGWTSRLSARPGLLRANAAYRRDTGRRSDTAEHTGAADRREGPQCLLRSDQGLWADHLHCHVVWFERSESGDYRAQQRLSTDQCSPPRRTHWGPSFWPPSAKLRSLQPPAIPSFRRARPKAVFGQKLP